ncbi:MAG: cysteine desulfurase [Gordonia sp.]|nr:cysteine desulfurase [Gordonia sp. (in: high G+C Gram-positive bacteria)]
MIYLDYNGSTPMDPQVADLVRSVEAWFANPSAVQHYAGQAAAEAIEESRHRVAGFAGRDSREVIFTSGASEAATIGIVGAMLFDPDRPNAIVSATEHEAILQAAATGARLSRGEVRTVRVHETGEVDLEHLASILDETVSVCAVMAANNETGVLNPIESVAHLTAEAGVLLLSDVTQLAGKADLGPAASGADMLVFSSHKIYGPKGAGTLVVDRRLQRSLVPILPGGGQERGLRGGTQNTASIAGFGLAAEIAGKVWADDSGRLRALSDRLHNGLSSSIAGVSVNGNGAQRLSNTLNLHFANADSDAVMASMPNVAVSSGSACHAAVTTQSHVLLAMHLDEKVASESLRISLGRPTTEAEVSTAIEAITSAVSRVRELTT